MDAAQGVSAVVAVGSVLIAALAYFKYKPGQREAVDMTIAQANMNVAQGTFQMVTTELEDQFKRMAGEVKELHQALINQRHEEAQYRQDVEKRLAELSALLRAANAEKETVNAENLQLRDRVQTLEAEVRALKASGGPHSPT